MTQLDTEEQAILDAFESGKVKPAEDATATQQRHRDDAAAMFRQDERINIRLTSKDLRGLQKKALAEGVPYQTLAASILHQYVEGRLCEHDR
ncbi:MAG: antitoxin [Lamprobacter sp.]|uniref:antitoxin n=1 Tax=Lamprobacter sp. TaxID=3100796 RepID=UPI002B2621A1|nr:antitoxin [Lamprobacter sp.]MEA3644121.1 antitoxin [Lamprobacter sp.]